jgi:hypothetical protein
MKVVLIITAAAALVLASSGLGASKGVNRQMFDGKYSLRLSGHITNVCPAFPAVHSTDAGTHTYTRNGVVPFTIRNGTLAGTVSAFLQSGGLVAGTPIRFSGLSLITGSIDVAKGPARTSLLFHPGHTNPKQIDVQYTVNAVKEPYSTEPGVLPKNCTQTVHFQGIGHRIGA